MDRRKQRQAQRERLVFLKSLALFLVYKPSKCGFLCSWKTFVKKGWDIPGFAQMLEPTRCKKNKRFENQSTFETTDLLSQNFGVCWVELPAERRCGSWFFHFSHLPDSLQRQQCAWAIQPTVQRPWCSGWMWLADWLMAWVVRASSLEYLLSLVDVIPEKAPFRNPTQQCRDMPLLLSWVWDSSTLGIPFKDLFFCSQKRSLDELSNQNAF